MLHDNGRSKPFVPGIALVWDDNFDSLELKKSIIKEADYKIELAANGAAWKMAERHLVLPAERGRKQAIDQQTHCKRALEASRMRET